MKDIQLLQVIYSNRTFTDKNGKVRVQKMFFLEFGNGKRVAIQPCFKEGYVLLDAFADVEYNDSVKQSENKK